jgi:hypothetical protein
MTVFFGFYAVKVEIYSDVSEEHTAFNFRVTESSSDGY